MVGKLYGIGRQAGLTDEQMNACMQDRALAEALVAEYQSQGSRRHRGDPDLPHQRNEGREHAYEEFAAKLDEALGADAAPGRRAPGMCRERAPPRYRHVPELVP